jgi:subtilisin family serine protease
MTRSSGAVLLTVCALAVSGGFAAGVDGAAAPLRQQELLVRFEPGASPQRAVAALGGTVVERLPLGDLTRVRLREGISLAQADAALERRSDVVFAEPNRTYDLYATPNDPDYSLLWGLSAIGAPTAWDLTQGSNSVVVAVVDSGVDYTHTDLDGNIWTNAAEISNGLDDDGNGLVDDRNGWDFYGGDAAPLDDFGHGTHVAGTIGAEGNNGEGITGVNWRVKVMPLRVGNTTLSGAAIYQAFRYACAKGARVVNGSFGGDASDGLIRMAIAECPGTLFVFSAGNSSRNVDALPTYPCVEALPNVICVAASQLGETLAPFSNFGVTNVDLAAPGAGILSTVPGGLFQSWDGTSMAAPHVAGAAALVLAQRPELSTLELKNALLLSVDAKPSYAGVVATGGRLNVARALGQEVVPPAGLAATSPSHLAGAWNNNQTVSLSWGGATDANGIDGYSYAFSPVPSFVPDEVKDVEETTTSLTMTLADGEHWFHIRARDGAGNWGGAVHVGPIRIDTFVPVRPVPSTSRGAAQAIRRAGWTAIRSPGRRGEPPPPTRRRTSRKSPRGRRAPGSRSAPGGSTSARGTTPGTGATRSASARSRSAADRLPVRFRGSAGSHLRPPSVSSSSVAARSAASLGCGRGAWPEAASSHNGPHRVCGEPAARVSRSSSAAADGRSALRRRPVW